MPIAVKDLCWSRDAPTRAGMAINRDFQATEGLLGEVTVLTGDELSTTE